ncbi:hypothetical protein M011DRAFT_464933 [Sporormia fimetaria CBS 119925]|uniref:Uncharacterized protein n=1 Tax=Sporormia fimetaria CBS 119925 TaxID=1340428 RepID=A0A6A6VHQ6_9PLEO|nr:hypothetical protein M011DRAFT_464933 [Sporormia fimetaria CBS 119925]
MMEGISNLNWEPPVTPLTVNTTIPTPYSMPVDVDLGPFSAGSLPSIAITEPGMSPVPSFWSGTTGASSPDRQSTSAPHVPLNLSRDIPTPFSPPGMAQNSQYWDFMAGTGGLKPQTSTTDSRDLSRRSSFSSASLASDHVPSSPTEEHSSSAGAQPLPSRFEAETLTTEFVQYIESIEGQKPYGLSPSVFGRICETVYPSSRARSASVDMPVSVPMARFHVFLTMAIGMKHRLKDSAEVTNALLDRCYELAMQQTASSTFWQEPGGVEAAQLLSIFASFKNEVPFEPRQLQPSFTW